MELNSIAAYAVFIDNKIIPPDGATELRVFKSIGNANKWAEEYASYDFTKGKEIIVKKVFIKYEV